MTQASSGGADQAGDAVCRPLVNLGQLRTLVAVVDAGGFSPAAAVLHLSQPTVSIHVRELEAEFGLRLLERGRRGVRPTAAGRIVVEHGREILARLGAIDGALDRLRLGTLGQLSLAASYTSYTYILPPILRDFRARFPDVRLATSTGLVADVLRAVGGGDADVGVAWAPVPREYQAWPLLEETFRLVVHGGHPLAGRTRVDPEEIGRHAFVTQSRGSSTRAFVEAAFERAGVRPQHVVEFGTPAGTKEGVLAGMGIGILAEAAMAREVAEGRLWPLEVAGLELRRRLVLLYRRQVELSGPARAFADFLLGRLRPSGALAAAGAAVGGVPATDGAG